jgi:FkbM family methyltransferase
MRFFTDLLRRRPDLTPDAALPVAVANAFRQMHDCAMVPNYERLLRVGYRRVVKPGATVIDVGAHEGVHLAHAADLVGSKGKVIGFEPLPLYAESLRARFAGEPNVEVRQLALAAEPATGKFYYVRNGAGESGLRHRAVYNAGEPDIEEIEVEIDTLDRQCADLARVDFVKIDVEGAEIDCLKGGTKLLARHRPYVSVEYGKPTYASYGYKTRSLFDFADTAGYWISDLFGNVIVELAAWEAICDCSYWDYFLVPREKCEQWGAAFET